MKITSLEDLNTLYNFQDMIILCEIFESRANFLNEKFKFNPRKCNSASSCRCCVNRDKSKVIIALPAEAETVQRFEKTLIGRFSAINTQLAFDTNILFPNKDEESKRQDLKIIYNTKNNGKSETKRIVSKILKMDENNQYGNAMAKPLPDGYIKKQKKFLAFENLT